MGNHSNKRPIPHKPFNGALPENEQPKVLTPAEKLLETCGGNLSSVPRLVARHQLKDRIKILEEVIRIHQPLVRAMQITQNAFQQGVMEGIRQVAAAEREKEQAAELAKDTEGSLRVTGTEATVEPSNGAEAPEISEIAPPSTDLPGYVDTEGSVSPQV